MSNTFNISVAPELAALSALVTIVDTVVDNIRGIDVPDIQTNIDANETKIDAIQTDQYFSVSLSDTLLLSADTEQIENTTSYIKVKEIVICISGYYRITWEMKVENAVNTMTAVVYKNGVLFGTEQTTASETYVSKSDELCFSTGDIIQLYIKGTGSDGGYNIYVQNFRIKGTISTPSGVVIVD